MLEIYFDGGCKPNPGMMEMAIVLVRDGTVIETQNEKLGMGTNNEAEWLSCLWGVYRAKELGEKSVSLVGDSKLVVCQAKGEWKCNKPNLIVLLNDFKEAVAGFDRLTIRHVLRDKNLAGRLLEGL